MEYKKLGNTGLEVSVIGFGGIPIQRVSASEAVAILRAANEAGINFIDTAHGYTCSEEKIGHAIQQLGGSWVLASKSMRRDAQGFREELLTTLRNLRVDSIDLYQLHNVSSPEDFDRVMKEDGAYAEALRAQKEGLIKHIGITSHKAEIAELAVKSGRFATIQVPFNPVESQFMPAIREANEKGMGVIVMKPLCGGAIENAELSLRYILEHEVTSVIPGMQSVSEVVENANAGDCRSLSDEERAKIVGEAEALGQQFCRRCEYCLPCPQGIKIPAMFIFDGYYTRYGLSEWASERYNSMAVKASDCIECGVCEERCPYNLPIREMLKGVVSRIEKGGK